MGFGNTLSSEVGSKSSQLSQKVLLILYYHIIIVITMHQKKSAHLCTHITSKRIELESPGWSGLVKF